MARKEHSKHYYYQHRGVNHERAARATSGAKAEGHREVARGYFKLAKATSGGASRSAAHHKGGKGRDYSHLKRKSHLKRAKNGRFKK